MHRLTIVQPLLESYLLLLRLHLLLQGHRNILELLRARFVLRGPVPSGVHLTDIGTGVHIPQLTRLVGKLKSLLHVLLQEHLRIREVLRVVSQIGRLGYPRNVHAREIEASSPIVQLTATDELLKGRWNIPRHLVRKCFGDQNKALVKTRFAFIHVAGLGEILVGLKECKGENEIDSRQVDTFM